MRSIEVERAASKGIVMGKAVIIKSQVMEIDGFFIKDDEKENEWKKYRDAIDESSAEIKALAENSDIFAAHLEIISDDELHDAVQMKIEDENKNVQMAVVEAVGEIVALFEGLDDEYLKERAVDIKDIGKRIVQHLTGIKENAFADIHGPSVVFAEDLTPSDTAVMDFNFVKGFVTEVGGVTSHVVIIARSLEIPAFVGVTGARTQVNQGDFIILDALENKILINPDNATIAQYNDKIEAYKLEKEELLKMHDLDATTKDGHTVELCANVGSVQDVENAVKNGAKGIGLFRSEFLYMDNTKFPTEEEQFEAYKKTAELMEESVIIRTLDIGGDKELSYYEFDKEENPFLGWRAIRICLDLKDVFKVQLRAILRASAFGHVRIMFPMMISVEEYRAAIEVLDECKAELRSENIKFDEKIEAGIMIETPAAVLCAEALAKEVDFFSIGTNDLTQYILAVDRGNQKISKMYNTFHPAVLHAIQTVIDAAHKYGKMAGMCGEFASDEESLPVLLGMGLDEFSMASVEISRAKSQLRKMNYEEAKVLAKEVGEQATIAEVKEVVQRFIKR
ncbi:MAG: phosphoenolpyruvate--protein phosphotransferase [Bacillota bacterium]